MSLLARSEQIYILEGFNHGMRTDGRENHDSRPHNVVNGTIPEAFGSSTLKFGEEDT